MRVMHSARIVTAQIKEEKDREYDRGNDVEPARVIPRDHSVLHSARRTRTGRDQIKNAKEQIDDHTGNNRRDVEDYRDVSRRARAVIFCVDQDERHDEEIAINESDDAAEADAVRPKMTRERNVADRANE